MYQDHGGGVGSPQHSPAMRKQDYVTLAVHTCLLVLTLGLALGVHQYAVHERDLEVHDATADRNLALMKMRTDAYLEKLALDAEFMAQAPIVRQYLEHPSAETLAAAESSMLTLASLRPHLDQVRYIDHQGVEQIRVDHRGGPPRLATQLQDKSERDYVQAGLELNAGSMYFSEIDLNIEYGQIERPFRPMLRVVAKVMANGHAAGMIVLNANADELGQRLKAVLPTAEQQAVVLNSDGGWIMGGGQKDWLFAAAPSAPGALLSIQEPALWSRIQASASGQFEYQGECHEYRWYQFTLRQGQSPRWLLAQRSPGQSCGHLVSSAVATWATQLAIFAAFTIPLLVLWHLSRSRARVLQRVLRESNNQLELVTQEADLALLMVDHQCRVCWVNPEVERLLGWKAAELVGENLHERIHQNHGESLHTGPCPTLQALQSGQRYRNDNDCVLARSGDVLRVSLRVSPYGEGEERKAIVTMVDVKEFAAREKRLTLLATTDGLTGALSRRSLLEHLQAMVDDPATQHCVLIADIDFFKKVNDTYGHLAGDQVLKTFTNTIRALLRKDDLLGRIGGEEFVVALKNTDLQNAQTLAERLRRAVAESQTTTDDGTVITITASFGLALYNGNELVEALLARADAALYRAKKSGRNRVETA